MTEMPIETKRQVVLPDLRELDALKAWFRTEYRDRLDKINRYQYLGIKTEDTRYALEKEAYQKEQRLRELQGLEPLPEIKFKKLL